ncbi:hypothetical protein [Haloarchaeobius baliensis]|uniref:hypothetical protein n=1 Tax=Haloarchaeobius baliensis TaxID=1670458 RepID=UPI003F884404
MTDNTDSDDSSNGWFTARKAFLAMFTLAVLSMVAVQPVMAQPNSIVCQDASTTNNLGDLVETFFQITTVAGLVGVFAVWQGGSVAEVLTLSQRQKRNIKEYKSSTMKAAVVMVLIGPMFTVFSSQIMSSQLGCLSLTQF